MNEVRTDNSELARAICLAHEQCMAAMDSALAHARSAGELLIEAKAATRHGEWLPWLAENCPGISAQVAQRYMRIAREWPRIEAANASRGTFLAVREALALLAVPHDPPPSVRRAVTQTEEVALSALRPSVLVEWHELDEQTSLKLIESLRRFGQIQPLVARTTGDVIEVICGRKVLAAMKCLGFTHAAVHNLGDVADEEVGRVALALDVIGTFNYPRLAISIAERLEAGETAEAIASISPYDTERVEQLGRCARFDWSQFDAKHIDRVESHARVYRCPDCGHEWQARPRQLETQCPNQLELISSSRHDEVLIP